MTLRPGQSFEEDSVAKHYAHRPPYPDEIFTKLIEISAGFQSLLDLGCGTGKIARPLSAHFQTVTAIDASAAMLNMGKRLPGGDTANLAWVQGLAETVNYPNAPFDLIVAAASIHWMNHAVLFPKLSAASRAPPMFAVVDGDDAHEPTWQEDWNAILSKWVPELTGEPYGQKGNVSFNQFMTRYKEWVDVTGEVSVISEPVSQPLHEFIACQHSRDTFAPSKLGRRMEAFDRELNDVLSPYTSDGHLSYQVKTDLTWGTIKSR